MDEPAGREPSAARPRTVEDDWAGSEFCPRCGSTSSTQRPTPGLGGRDTRVGPPESKGWWLLSARRRVFSPPESPAQLSKSSAKSVFIEDREFKRSTQEPDSPRRDSFALGAAMRVLGLACPELVGAELEIERHSGPQTHTKRSNCYKLHITA